MSTYITVASDTSSLVNRVKQVQHANREAQLQRQRDIALEAEIANESQLATAQAERPIGGNPDTSIDRRPSAQRKGLTVGNVWLATDIYARTLASGIVALPADSVFGVGYTGPGSIEVGNRYGLRIGCASGARWEVIETTQTLPSPPAVDTYAPIDRVSDGQLNHFGACRDTFYGNRDVGYSPVWQGRTATLVLPAGGTKAVVAISARTASYRFDYYQTVYDVALYNQPGVPNCTILPDYKLGGPAHVVTLHTDYQYKTFCYLIDETAIREVSVPEKISEYLLILNPAAVLRDRTVSTIVTQVPALPSPPTFSNFDTETIPFGDGVTPQVFYELNQLLPYTDTLKTAADYKGKPIVNWLFDGGYKLIRDYGSLEAAYDSISAETPFGFIHAEYKGDTNEGISLLNRGLLKRISRFTKMRNREPLPAQSDFLRLIKVFDWDAPAYCRSQLLALGFNSSDIS